MFTLTIKMPLGKGKKVKEIKDCITSSKHVLNSTIILIMIGAVMETSIPFLVARLIDYERDVAGIIQIGILIAGAATLALLTSLISCRNTVRISVKTAQLLRNKVYQKVQQLSFRELDAFTNISITTRLTTDISNLQSAGQTALNVLIRSLAIMLCTLVATAIINPLIGVIFLVILILAVILVLAISQKALPHFGKGLAVYDNLNLTIQDNAAAARVIKAFAKEEREIEKFKTGSQLMYELFVKAEKVMLPANPLMTLAVDIGLIVVIWTGSKRVLSGSLSTGDFIILFTYTMNLLAALVAFMGGLFTVFSTIPSMKRVSDVIEAKGEPASVDSVSEMADGSIDFHGVSFQYHADSKRCDLEDISVSIGSGEMVGIIGGIGSGKSTFAQLIAGLYEPTAGVILIGEVPISHYQKEILSKYIGMVMQKSLLFSGTIADNLRWGNANAEDAELHKALQCVCADSFVEALDSGLNTYVEQGGTNFSGGQRQRLSIARALLKKPKILILDDATSAVDARTDRTIREYLQRGYPDVTKVVISQRVAAIYDCDRILVFDEGKICGCGTHEELLDSNRIYREIFMSQQGGGDFDVR